MAFIPRLTCPDKSEKWWLSSENPCIARMYGTVLPNCVGYAYGRFAEIMGKWPTGLSRGAAGAWIATSSGFQTGKEPRLGAVIVWSKSGGAGHVAIVEKINADGSIVISQSGYSASWANRFWTQTLQPPYKYGSSYNFLGFIYNPAVSGVESSDPQDVVEAIVSEARKHIGEDNTWVRSVVGIGASSPWCAAFVCSVMRTIGGILGKVLYESWSCHDMSSVSVSRGYGQWIPGPADYSSGPTSVLPQRGDLAFFSWSGRSTRSFGSDHVGIVAEVNGNSITTVEGNTTYNGVKHRCGTRTYSSTYRCIVGYYRPNYANVEGFSYNPYGGGMLVSSGPLYTTKSSRADATLREVGYLDARLEPSIKPGKYRLSAINYTQLVGALFDSVQVPVYEQYSAGGSVDASGLKNTNARAIFEFLRNKGMNASQCVGILANIQRESAFSPSAVNPSSGASGLCQWLGGRRTNMIQHCGADWRNNLTRQCEFLWTELNGAEKAALSALQTEITSDSLQMALRATDIFLRKFERPGHLAIEYTIRARFATELWGQLVIVPASTAPVSLSQFNMITNSGNTLRAYRTIEVPSTIKQTGIVANYTSYTTFYPKWSRSSVQRKIADIWDNKGRKSSHHVCTIDGYYLVATTLKFGTTGDVIAIFLEDGTRINAIIADSKGADVYYRNTAGEPGNEWGHALGRSGVDIIEWEEFGKDQDALRRGLQEAGWLGKKVARIQNYGSYLS